MMMIKNSLSYIDAYIKKDSKIIHDGGDDGNNDNGSNNRNNNK